MLRLHLKVPFAVDDITNSSPRGNAVGQLVRGNLKEIFPELALASDEMAGMSVRRKKKLRNKRHAQKFLTDKVRANWMNNLKRLRTRSRSRLSLTPRVLSLRSVSSP